MIIQCSQCSARYMVPDQSIGIGGRTVRCARCQHSWFVTTPADRPLAELEAIMAEQNKPKPIPPGSNLPVVKAPPAPLALKASVFGMLAATLTLLLLALWPETYGYPRSEGLALAEVSMLARYDEAHPENQTPLYEITGKIINVSDDVLEVPILRITLVDKEGATLQYWDFSEKGRLLEKGGNIPFSTGPLDIKFSNPSRFLVELGSEMELALRDEVE